MIIMLSALYRPVILTIVNCVNVVSLCAYRLCVYAAALVSLCRCRWVKLQFIFCKPIALVHFYSPCDTVLPI